MKRGVVLAVLLALCAADSRAGTQPPATCGKMLPPSSWGAYLGAFADFNAGDVASEDHVRTARIESFERLADHRLSWVYFSQNWYRGLQFPRERVQTIWRHGSVPYIAFLPTSGDFYGTGRLQHNPEKRYTLQRIIDGVFDRQLRAWADGARRTNVPILLSFGAEVNDDWGPWNGKWNGAGETTGYGDPAYPDGPERYRDAYRHLVDVFREEGATNVTFVFHVDSYPPLDGWNELHWYYPGDVYVDWIGISVYGRLYPKTKLAPFAPKLSGSGVYATMAKLSRRPFAIAEMGVAGDARWIRDAFAAIRSGKYPRIRAVTWWNMDTDGIDTRIDQTPASLEAFRAGVAGTFFSGGLRFSSSCR